MSIVSSTYVLNSHSQTDGRRYVTEQHTDSQGVVHEVSYLAAPNTDYAAVATARAAQMAELLADQEAAQIIGAG